MAASVARTPLLLRATRRMPVLAAAVVKRRESSAASAWKNSVANKTGLSKQLDSTMHDGSHDMKAFGLGFLRSLASRKEQAAFNVFLWNVYTTMEESFDAAAARSSDSQGGAAMRKVWDQFATELRRKEALREDLALLGIEAEDKVATAPSEATQAYLAQIKKALDADADLLLGHFYTRYFADLFGGSMQGFPTRLALGLGQDLRFYTFPPAVEADKRAYIERIYAAINEASEGMEREKKRAIVDVARDAFRRNADVYTERPYLVPAAGVGAVRCGLGLVYGTAAMQGDMREWCTKMGVIKPKSTAVPAA